MTVASIPDRARKLLTLALVTDKAGEAAAATEALRRTLRAAGLDIHDLVNGLVAQPDQPDQPDQPPVDGWRQQAKCLLETEWLDDREREFLSNMARYRRTPSEKQMKWLADLWRRHGTP